MELQAGLHFLKHTFGLSDALVVAQWVMNPSWQFVCGKEFYQHELPTHPSQMTRWRKQIDEAGVEKMLGSWEGHSRGSAAKAAKMSRKGNSGE